MSDLDRILAANARVANAAKHGAKLDLADVLPDWPDVWWTLPVEDARALQVLGIVPPPKKWRESDLVRLLAKRTKKERREIADAIRGKR